MTLPALPSVEGPKTLYFVERRPSPPLSCLEKVKHIAGAVIACFGLALLAFAAASFVGSVVGLASLTLHQIEMPFMIGFIATVAGFNLAAKSSQNAEVYLGAFSVTV